MPLVKCKDCKHEISKKAKFCPNCGAPVKKRTSLVSLILALIFGVWFFNYLFSEEQIIITPEKIAHQKKVAEQIEIRDRTVSMLFDCEEIIKNDLYYASSYKREHYEGGNLDNNGIDIPRVLIDFTTKNEIGNEVPLRAVCTFENGAIKYNGAINR